MHYDAYQRFVIDPPRYDISIKMPKLSANGRTTAVTRYYDGDAQRQYDAIWHYLQHYDRLSHETR